MAMVSPSILSANFAHLEEDCRKALDGGINLETGKQSMAAGADVLVAGSTVFGTEDITAACQRLSEI